MSDQELADKVVAHGVGELHRGRYWIDNESFLAGGFVRDWRVAGALMERVGNGFEYALCVDTWQVTMFEGSGEGYTAAEGASLPRAIIEACVEALSDE